MQFQLQQQRAEFAAADWEGYRVMQLKIQALVIFCHVPFCTFCSMLTGQLDMWLLEACVPRTLQPLVALPYCFCVTVKVCWPLKADHQLTCCVVAGFGLDSSSGHCGEPAVRGCDKPGGLDMEQATTLLQTKPSCSDC